MPGRFPDTSPNASPLEYASFPVLLPYDLGQRISPAHSVQKTERITQSALPGRVRADERSERPERQRGVGEVLEVT